MAAQKRSEQFDRYRLLKEEGNKELQRWADLIQRGRRTQAVQLQVRRSSKHIAIADGLVQEHEHRRLQG